nr:SLC13 family permease [Pseudactinotalea sp. HY160]
MAGVAVAVGLVPLDAARVQVDRIWPVLLFVLAITIVAELASVAGVFDAAARWAVPLSGGRTWLLCLTVVVPAAASTIFPSLDTTAVLLTPVVVLAARGAGAPPVPFALVTVWLANTGSMLLPVSNLTNLLASGPPEELAVGEFVALTSVPAMVAIVLLTAIIAVVFRRELRGGFGAVGGPGASTTACCSSGPPWWSRPCSRCSPAECRCGSARPSRRWRCSG